MADLKRQTAYKVFIGDLIKGDFVKGLGEWEPNYVLVDDKKVSRVNIIASVISKYETPDKNYSAIDVDDGSGVISLKTWKEDIILLDGLDVGDLVLVIGRTRQYNDQIYITPEIVKILTDLTWSKLRKAELEKIWGEREETKLRQETSPTLVVSEEVVGKVTETSRQKILNIIEKEEVDLKRLIELSNLESDEVKTIVQTLLKEGEIYEPKPGVLKIV